ncbi:MFS transporter [Nocardioides sp. YIM 152315]|uniref:MFS transporter n=1 Tax=Nocardioides sp. YIM 152315 TaxID=3031760 RepID=UPI0023D9E6A2|nr:MFS transporter [Nocardioides sp. YIM 152315]MDF1603770.1 MFS transporter [Nocardioides sp. YIM 152315]
MTSLLHTRNAVALSFALNGFCFATMVSRLPDIRSGLELDNAALGLLLLAISVGSVIALPLSGRLIDRFGATWVTRLGAVLVVVGLSVGMLGVVTDLLPLTAVGFFLDGVGIAVWDVSMNVEAAEVERRLERTIMPRFHAGWSLGSFAGAAIGIPMAAVHAPLMLHVPGFALLAGLATWRAAATYLPAREAHEERQVEPFSPWREPRTLAIGVMVLAFALTEGAANDWLALALIDGYDVRHWVGVTGFTVFVCSMMAGRLYGPVLLDRYGRAPVLWASSAAAFVGILLVVFGAHVVLVGLGIVVWGLGASLGFPVGMSAAADDPLRAARRVSAVSTIGYTAFLAGPPLLGLLADHVGTLETLLVIAALMIPAAATVFAARERRPSPAEPDQPVGRARL